MNITDHIVSLLKSGTTVEMNGIGAFVVITEDAYMDENTNTFYPKKQTVEFQPYSDDRGNIIQLIAKKECVDETTAAKMWKNFSDALMDKMKTQKHTFPEIGDLSFENGTFVFAPAEALNLMKDRALSEPLTDVEKITDVPNNDPFAVFDNPDAFVQEEPEPEQEQAVSEEAVAEQEENMAYSTENTETEHVEVTNEPQPEIPSEFEMETKPEPVSEPAPLPSTPAPSEEIKETEPIVSENDSITNMFDDVPETTNNKTTDTLPEKKKHKGRKALIIILIILLLLALGGAAYYYFFIMKKSASDTHAVSATTEQPTEDSLSAVADDNATEAEDEVTGTAPDVNTSDFDYTKYTNPFTYDASLVEITNPNAVEENRYTVLNLISDRLNKFLVAKQYSTATSKMKEKLTGFIDERLDEKLNNTDRYHISKFFNYNDFVREYINDELQDRKQKRARYEVISEIFDNSLFSQYLQELIDAGEVEKDVIIVPPEPVYTAPIYSSTKQGFDVIAGTYKDKASAMKMASILRRKGADAYVINKGDFYYVSAGSAPSQTKIEAVMFQLKTWYTSNLAIKKW